LGITSSRVSAAVQSATCPPVRRNASGLHRASVRAWIFVVRPPRERPIACVHLASGGANVEQWAVKAVTAGRNFLEQNPHLVGGAAVGGEVRIVQITPEGMVIFAAHRFDYYEQLARVQGVNLERAIKSGETLKVEGLVHVDDVVH
jgi:hypothetical protein